METDVRPKPNLRAFLDERGVRYVWVAQKLGVSKAHLWQIMEGQRPITSERAQQLATLFDVPVSTFSEVA